LPCQRSGLGCNEGRVGRVVGRDQGVVGDLPAEEVVHVVANLIWKQNIKKLIKLNSCVWNERTIIILLTKSGIFLINSKYGNVHDLKHGNIE